jgi:phosphoribosyl 1,2-cyclic phosphodiesterase
MLREAKAVKSNMGAALQLRFWGVRGSFPTPHARNLGYGGNTSCLELWLPGVEPVVFDAGTGICSLGCTLPNAPLIHLFFTHFHWDHVHGLPFFSPLHRAGTHIRYYSARALDSLEGALASSMRSPYFPVDFHSMPSQREYIAVGKQGVQVGPATIRPFPVHHPQGAHAYRIELDGAVVVYATDREHGNEALDAILAEHVRGADVLIHDAQYTGDEFERLRGRGHSTWEESVRIAQECGVKKLVLFHHDPYRDDKALGRIEAAAKQRFENTVAAREGMTIEL